jgi:hypothetical protein
MHQCCGTPSYELAGPLTKDEFAALRVANNPIIEVQESARSPHFQFRRSCQTSMKHHRARTFAG